MSCSYHWSCVYISRHVVFDETFFPFSKKLATPSSTYTQLYKLWTAEERFLQFSNIGSINTLLSQHTSYVQDPTAEQVLTEHTVPVSTTVLPVDQASSTSQCISPQVDISGPTTETTTEPDIDHIDPNIQTQSIHPMQGIQSTHHMQTRSKSGIVKVNPRYACLAQYQVPPKPKSIKSALADPGWYQAMQEEMNALHHNQTWLLVPRTNDMNVIGCKWVFKTKLTSIGSLDRLKARLVAKGFHQEEGIDFTETFSPVIKHATVRLILSVAMIKHWSIHQLDVKNAFLHGTLNKTVYMEQPPGFVHPQYSQYVCLLQKSLYGLRQAPRAWYDKFSNFLLEVGFFCSTTDPSLFILHQGQETILLLLYVDDIILTGSSEKLLQTLIHSLSVQFHMKDLGHLHYFLGIEATRTSTELFLCQTKYALDLLSRAHMTDCKPIATPLSLKPVILKRDADFLPNPMTYRSLVGGLQYLTITRPDLAFATNILCQKLQQPTIGDFLQLKRVLRYVKGTVHLGISLHSQSSLNLYGFSDADWAG